MADQDTKEDFVRKAKAKHGVRYDYSKVVYTNNSSNVIITCRLHGDFSQIASMHTSQGSKCPECAKEDGADARRSSTEDFIKRAKNKHKDDGFEYDYSKTIYVNPKVKVIITCPVHGDFEQLPYSHLRPSGCKKCGTKRGAALITKSDDDFISEATLIHKGKYDYSKVEYKGSFINVIIKCNECNSDFEQTPHNHLAGGRCKNCYGHNIKKE